MPSTPRTARRAPAVRFLLSLVRDVHIALLYNATAGDGLSPDSVRGALERGGHEVVQTVRDIAQLDQLQRDTVEALVVAGGDGTVSQAASALLGRGIPLAILPMGTANNIAAALGLDRPPQQLIAGWSAGRRRTIDVGVARGEWGWRLFLEAVGTGLIPWGIAAIDGEKRVHEEDAATKLERALRTYRHVLSGLRPRHWEMTLDGVRTDGQFLLVEVLNTGAVGPNLVLSEDADPSDGVFSVVTAGEEHRDALDGYLLHRIEGRECALALPTQRAREVEIHGVEDAHVDGDLHAGRSHTVSLRIRPAALDVLQ